MLQTREFKIGVKWGQKNELVQDFFQNFQKLSLNPRIIVKLIQCHSRLLNLKQSAKAKFGSMLAIKSVQNMQFMEEYS